jgi:hypothetical protein
LGGGREAFWALVSQLAVRPVIVVLAPVVLNDDAGFGQGPELLPLEALVAQASTETLDEAVLPRTAGLDIDRLDLIGGQPLLDFLGDKLGAIVTSQLSGLKSHSADGLGEDVAAVWWLKIFERRFVKRPIGIQRFRLWLYCQKASYAPRSWALVF